MCQMHKGISFSTIIVLKKRIQIVHLKVIVITNGKCTTKKKKNPENKLNVTTEHFT